MRVGKLAWKHGISEPDIRHAMRRIIMAEDLTMLIGPAQEGTLLEVGILDHAGEDPVVIHAMELRRKFYRFL